MVNFATVGSMIYGRHVARTNGRKGHTELSGAHRIVSGAPTGARVATVDCAKLGRRSATDMLQCLSGGAQELDL
jgi:hypothetical protein